MKSVRIRKLTRKNYKRIRKLITIRKRIWTGKRTGNGFKKKTITKTMRERIRIRKLRTRDGTWRMGRGEAGPREPNEVQ